MSFVGGSAGVCAVRCVGAGRHWITGMQHCSHPCATIQFGRWSRICGHLGTADTADLRSAHSIVLNILENRNCCLRDSVHLLHCRID